MARRRLLLSMSSIMLGVAGLVAIDSLAANATSGVHDQARSLVGGDVAMSPRDTLPTAIAHVLDSLSTHGTGVATQTSFISMASGGAESALRLVQVRAVSVDYPFFGGVRTEPEAAWSGLHTGRNAVADAAVLSGLGIHVGDSISLGGVTFALTGIIRDVASDVAITTTLGPRVYIPAQYLPATHLVVTGSRAQRDIVLRLPPTMNEETFATRFGPSFGRAGVRIRTAEQNADRVSETIGYLRNFLALVGLIALLLGGIGVASGVRAFVLRKIDTVAVLRCLGATGRQVLLIYVTQAAALGLFGAVIGAAAGVVLQFVLGSAIGRYLPAGMSIHLAPAPILFGVLTGVWVALVCALQPLLSLRRVSPLQALRREEDSVALGRHADWASRFVGLLMVASLLFVTVARARRWQEGVAFAVGILFVMGALWVAAAILSRVARGIVRPFWPFPLRHGVASLHRPGNQTRAVVVSLGFGVFLIGTLYQTQSSLLAVMADRLSQLHANVVFFDIQSDQADGVDSALALHHASVLARIPILTVRIGAIKGRTIADIMGDTTRDTPASGGRGGRNAQGSGGGGGGRGGEFNPRRALGREWRATYSDTLGSSETVVAGKWFGEAPKGTGEVSLDSAAAARLRVKIGDEIQWQLQGVPILTRVTSFRSVDRTQLQPAFQVVFPSALVRGAPMQFAVLANAVPDTVPAIQRDVVGKFSNVSTVDLSLVEATISAVLAKIHAAIQGLTIMCVVLAIPVLFSAVAATRRERLREAVLLKVLGATRKQVGRMLVTEYLVVGALGSMAGIVLSGLAAWSITHFIFKVPFVGAPLASLGIAGLMIGVVVAIGMLTGREVFMSTPMAALRE
ncbi:MAG: FtsX-like permease family protein [Gemmatimonadota bacterium]|nr:FtsX-like permease family protein [Gemmatimonadota bacterium]